MEKTPRADSETDLALTWDFSDAPVAVTEPRATTVEPPPRASYLQQLKGRGGLFGTLASVFLLLFKLKFLLTGASMFVSMWAYAQQAGWPFAVGFVLMIFIHECGHVLAAKIKGAPVGLMMFIPLMGAFVMVRRGKDVAEDAFVGIMGPVAGATSGLLAGVVYLLTGLPLWLHLSQWTLMLNLLNLAPMPPLDGGRISAAVFGGQPTKQRSGAEDEAYYHIDPETRRRFGWAYFGLAFAIVVTTIALYQFQKISSRYPSDTGRAVQQAEGQLSRLPH